MEGCGILTASNLQRDAVGLFTSEPRPYWIFEAYVRTLEVKNTSSLI